VYGSAHLVHDAVVADQAGGGGAGVGRPCRPCCWHALSLALLQHLSKRGKNSSYMLQAESGHVLCMAVRTSFTMQSLPTRQVVAAQGLGASDPAAGTHSASPFCRMLRLRWERSPELHVAC
jgi:hypothetical protein